MTKNDVEDDGAPVPSPTVSDSDSDYEVLYPQGIVNSPNFVTILTRTFCLQDSSADDDDKSSDSLDSQSESELEDASPENGGSGDVESAEDEVHHFTFVLNKITQHAQLEGLCCCSHN